jgi:hypothetical protein
VEVALVMTVASEASWLLLALGTAGRRKHPDLSSVLGAADAINHAVMTYPEFRRATALLMAMGLVEPPEGLRLTRAGRELLRGHDAPTWHQQWVAQRNALEKSDAPEASPTSVSEMAFNEAVSEYLARHE